MSDDYEIEKNVSTMRDPNDPTINIAASEDKEDVEEWFPKLAPKAKEMGVEIVKVKMERKPLWSVSIRNTGDDAEAKRRELCEFFRLEIRPNPLFD